MVIIMKNSKIMLFNRQGHLIEKYRCHAKLSNIEEYHLLKKVMEYKYLCFTFSSSCSANPILSILYQKTKTLKPKPNVFQSQINTTVYFQKTNWRHFE